MRCEGLLTYKKQIFNVGTGTVTGACGQQMDATQVSAAVSNIVVVMTDQVAHVQVEKQ